MTVSPIAEDRSAGRCFVPGGSRTDRKRYLLFGALFLFLVAGARAPLRPNADLRRAGGRTSEIQEGVPGSRTTVPDVPLDVDGRSVASVSVSPGSWSLEVGEVKTFTAAVRDSTGELLLWPVRWTTTDSSVATVDSVGRARARASGAAGVVATADGVSDTATVSVSGSPSPDSSPSVSPATLAPDAAMVDVASSTPTSCDAGSVDAAVIFDPDCYSTQQELEDDPYGVFSATEIGGNYNLDKQVGYPGGSHSMRYDWVDQGTSSVGIGRRMPLPSATKEVWVEFWVKWSENFMCCIDYDSLDGAYSHKLFFMQSIAPETSPNWETSDGCSVLRWSILMPSGGSTNPPNGNPLIGTPATDTCDTDNEDNITSANAADYFDGQWHRVRLHFRHDPGLAEFWIDGNLISRFEGYTIHPEIVMTALLPGRNKDGGNPSGTESLWWGTIKAWTEDPGW